MWCDLRWPSRACQLSWNSVGLFSYKVLGPTPLWMDVSSADDSQLAMLAGGSPRPGVALPIARFLIAQPSKDPARLFDIVCADKLLIELRVYFLQG